MHHIGTSMGKLGWRKAVVAGLVALLPLLALFPGAAQAAPAQSYAAQEQWARVYVVRHGDTLGGIALRFGVTQDALMKANRIQNPNRIFVGQQLIIPDAPAKPGPGGTPCVQTHIVRRGETLSGIALWLGCLLAGAYQRHL